MNTSASIPWDAVVGDVPASQTKALPIVLSSHYVARCWGPSMPLAALGLSKSLASPLAIMRRSGALAMLELSVLSSSQTALLTSDGETSVMVQAAWPVPRWSCVSSPELMGGNYVRQYVARHAWLDSDAKAFVLPDRIDEDKSPVEFLHPPVWGFTNSPRGMRWTAENIYETATSDTKRISRLFPFARPRFSDPSDCSNDSPCHRGDPFQCLPQLQQIRIACHRAIDELKWPREDFGAKSYPGYRLSNLAAAIALGLGRCRLFGVAVGEGDFTLTAGAAELGAQNMRRQLYAAARWAKRIGEGAVPMCAYTEQEIALQLLEIRMDAHASYLALDEAYAAAHYEGAADAMSLGRHLHQIRRLIEMLDANLQKQMPLLRLAASTRLLENWRRLLAPCYRELPPWWLDGCLDDRID